MSRLKDFMLKILLLIISFSFAGVSYSQKKIDPLLKSANDAFYSQKWKSAATLLDLYLKDSVNFSEPYKKAIIANLMVSDADATDRGIALIDKQEKPLKDVLKSISEELIRLRMFDDYEIIIHKLINKMPTKKEFLYDNLISFRTLLHQPEDVIRIIEESDMYDIPASGYTKKKAYTYILTDNIDKAYSIFDSIYINDRNDKDAIIFFSNYYYVKGKLEYDKIINEYEKIQTPTNLDYAEKRNKIGVVYRDYFVRAIEWMEKAKDISQNENIEKNLNFMYDVRAKYSTDIANHPYKKRK